MTQSRKLATAGLGPAEATWWKHTGGSRMTNLHLQCCNRTVSLQL